MNAPAAARWVDVAGTRTPLAPGQSVLELLKQSGGEDIWGENPVVLATVNGRRVSLAERLWGEERVELMRLSDSEAHSTAVRTLCFVLAAAAEELFPQDELFIDFSYGPGMYCELRRSAPLTQAEIALLEERMRQLAARDLPLLPQVFAQRELLKMARAARREFSFRAARYLRRESLTLFRLEGHSTLFYGLQLPSTGHVRAFRLQPEPPGFVLLPSLPGLPRDIAALTPQPKLLETMRAYSRWCEQMGFPDLGSLNRFVVEGRAAELIQVCEARHSQILVQTAARAAALPESGRLILIAGPSSSGKTSFAKRLAVHLRVLGFSPLPLSLDDYFVERSLTPRDADGEYDYESLAALQVDLFNEHLTELLAGRPVRLPRYDFHAGASAPRAEPTSIEHGQPLIVEGIHALNPALTAAIPDAQKLRIYVSALGHFNIDNFSYIPTTLTRLYRRIVRDAQFRGYTASQTLARWPKVRAGEQRHVFPFQQNADVFFNSSLAYELGVLKLWAEPRLSAVEPEDANYGPARSLIELLTLMLPIDARQVPPTSLLREFIGGSGFQY